MSRTYHRSKGPGFEYWASRLHPGGEDPGRWTKTQTHRKERRDAKKQIEVDVLAEADALIVDLAEADGRLGRGTRAPCHDFSVCSDIDS